MSDMIRNIQTLEPPVSQRRKKNSLARNLGFEHMIKSRNSITCNNQNQVGECCIFTLVEVTNLATIDVTPSVNLDRHQLLTFAAMSVL